LEVRASNERARHLYEKFEFEAFIKEKLLSKSARRCDFNEERK
jgi:ribosomal protein S18 acetylase RimI-like enzyme